MKLSTGLTAAMVALVLLTATAVGLLIYRNVQAEMLAGELERAEIHARALAGELEAHVRNARGDALGFRSAVALAGIVRATLAGGTDPRDGTSEAEWRTRMASRYVAELAAKPSYIQFRIIGVADGGRELVRVYRSDGMIRIADDAELRRVGEATFFREAIRLPAGYVYVSPIELPQEADGAVPSAREPMLRVATPVHAPNGEVFGVVVIGVDLRPAFDLIRAAARPGQSIYVVNEQGDFLMHPDPAREFGFQRGNPRRWQDELPALAAALGPAQRGAHVVTNPSGVRVGAALASVRLAQGPRVAVIATVPYEDLMAPARAVGNSTLIVGLIAVLFAVLLAVLLARSLARPLSQMTRAVEAFASGKPMVVPTHASHELGVLARAFEHMAAEVREKTAAVRRNAEVLDKIVASMADAVLVVDRDGKTVFSNPALVTLFGDHAKIGSPEWRETYHRFRPDGVTPYPHDETPIGRAIRGESFDNLELLMRRKGETHTNYIVASGRPIVGEGGTPEGAVIVYRDVTAVKEIELQLRQAHKLDAIGQLTGGVAHDFNNILTVITGTIEILADGVRERPKLSAIAAMIDEAATRGAALTQQLLAFARKQALEPRETDVNALIVETASLLRPTLGEHIEIESMLEDEAWRALIDPSQLSTALLNLAVNARDAMPNGGKLTLETGNVILDETYAEANADVKAGHYVMIAVSDTGTGIPAAIRDKVFEPFFTTKDVGKGTGLGLSMVYGFVKQSGGHIKIYSEEGHGTTIKLYLPRMQGQADRQGEPAPLRQLQGGHETILVVEDDVLVRDYVIAQLQSLGYQTIAAATAAEAIAAVDKGARFDLLFTDVIMPGGMNGRQLAEELMRRLGSVRVLYTSGYTENAIVHHGRLDAGVALLNKPYRKSDLAAKIRDVLAQEPRGAAA